MTQISVSHHDGTSTKIKYLDGDVNIATADAIPAPGDGKLIISWVDTQSRNNWIHFPGSYIRESTRTPVNTPLATGFVTAAVRYGDGIVARVPGRHLVKAESFDSDTIRQYLGTNPQTGEGIYPGVARFSWPMPDGTYQSFSIGSWRVDALPQGPATGFYVTDTLSKSFAVNPGDSVSKQYKYTFTFTGAADAGTTAIIVRDSAGNDLGVLLPDIDETLTVINPIGNSVFSLTWGSTVGGSATVAVDELPYTPEVFGEVNPGSGGVPTIVSNPVITSNINQVGGVATITQPGSFTSGAVTSYVWRRGTTVVAGQTGTSYTFTSADIGAQIQAGLFDSVSGLTAWSNSTGVIVNPSASGEAAYTVSLLKPAGIGATEIATAAGTLPGRYIGAMTQAEVSKYAGFFTTGSDYLTAGQMNNSVGIDLTAWEFANGESLIFQWRGIIPTVPAGKVQYIAAQFKRAVPERGFFLYYYNGNLTGGIRPGDDASTGSAGVYIDYQIAPGTEATVTMVFEWETKQFHMHLNGLATKTGTIPPHNGSYKTNNAIGMLIGSDQAGGEPLHAAPLFAETRHKLVRIGVLPNGVAVAADNGRSLHDAVVADVNAVIGVGHYNGTAAQAPAPAPAVTVASNPVISSLDLEVGTSAQITTRGTFNNGTTNSNLWRRGTTELAGETGLSYTYKAADIGQSISAGTRDASGVTAWSNALGPIVAEAVSAESQYSVSVLRSSGIAAGQVNTASGTVVGRYLGGLSSTVASQAAGYISTGQDADNGIGLDDLGWDLGANESIIVQWAGIIPAQPAGSVGWIVDGLRANDPRRGFYLYMLNGSLYAGVRTNPDGGSTATYTESFRAGPASGDGVTYITFAVNGSAKTTHLWVGDQAVIDKTVTAAAGSYKTLNDQGCVIGGRAVDGSGAASGAYAMRTKLFRAVVLPAGTALKADKGQSAHEALVFNTGTALGNTYFTA